MGVSKYIGLLAAIAPLINAAPTGETLHPEMLKAMKRDLGLDAEQAHARVARELSAVDTIAHLRNTAGDAFAGAWLADNGATINVAVTDEAMAAEVTAAGARAAIVANSANRLEQAKAALDGLPADANARGADSTGGVAAWYVDVQANKVILEAVESGVARAKEMAKEVGLTDAEFEVRTVNEMPTTFATSQGGLPYFINNAGRCSIGFTVTTGFVTAGHCGRAGATANNYGTFSGSSFPGNDYAYVRTTSGTVLSGTVKGASGSLRVAGSTAAAVGASVCRSGSTTGYRCGAVQQLGATVSYAEGRVTGLTRTSVCAEPGDSGGSFISGTQAQGVTSGGSGNCQVGGTTYHQPVNEILSAYGLTLVRS